MAVKDITEETETKVRKYFKKRGWSVRKLDKDNEEAADFKLSNSGYAFLCEVKTIESDRASGAYTLSNSYKRYISEIRSLEKNPEFKVYPFRLRIDSDDLYLPTKKEKADLISWLKKELRNLTNGKIGRQWRPDSSGFGTEYEFLDDQRNRKGVLQINLFGPFKTDSLKIDFHYYGVLNQEAIERNVSKGKNQLNSSAAKEENKRIPRIIVLRLVSGIGFQQLELEKCISNLLSANPHLSAIAFFYWVLKPRKGLILSFWENILRLLLSPRTIAFNVYHNGHLEYIEKLQRFVFDDGISTQINIR